LDAGFYIKIQVGSTATPKWNAMLENLPGNRMLAGCARLLPANCSSADLTRISPVGDQVALFSAARRSAKPGREAFISPRSFGSGCAARRNMRARKTHRIERICVPWAFAGEIIGEKI